MKTILKVLLDWENILTMHIPDKEPVSRLSKEINSMDCSPPVCSVHGILQARVLEWVCHLLLQPVKAGGE